MIAKDCINDNVFLPSIENKDIFMGDIKKEEKEEATQVFFSVDDVTEIKKVFNVEEISEKRKVNGKVFKMNNDFEKLEIYPETIHIYDENNHRFEKIDNSITEDAQADCFKNENSHFEARFSKNQDNDELFLLKKAVISLLYM